MPWSVVTVLLAGAAIGAVLATMSSAPRSSLRSTATTATTTRVKTLPGTTVPATPTATTPSTIPSGPPAPPPPGPLAVDAAAWRGHGELAFVSQGKLEVLTNNGDLATVTGPPAGGYDSNPAWSADNHWLAFVNNSATTGFEEPTKTLWIAQSGSTQAHVVTAAAIGTFAWSPSASMLAYTVAPNLSTGPAINRPEQIWFDTPDRAPVSLMVGSGSEVDTIAWSPNGTQLAFDDSDVAVKATATSPAMAPFGRLGVVTIASREVRDVFTLSGGRAALAGWWPSGQGLLFWEDPGFAEEADGEMLYSLPSYGLGTGSPRPVALVRSLVDPGYVVPDPGGTTVAVTAGGDRSIWASGRDVDLCSFPAQTCRGLALPSGTEALHPSFMSFGPLLFVDASNSGPFGGLMGRAFWSSGWMAEWERTNRLSSESQGITRFLAGAPTGTVIAVPSGTDNAVLAIADNALWLSDPTVGAAPTKVAGPLYSVTAPSGYYGEVPWSSAFAWSAAGVLRSGTSVGSVYSELPLESAVP